MNSLIRNIKIAWINNEIHPVEQHIIDLLNKCEIEYKGDFIIWMFERKYKFYLYKDVFCIDNETWNIFQNDYKLNYPDAQIASKFILEKHLNVNIKITHPM